MSVNWWEIWSPGLQAAAGFIELLGAALLGFEWWQGIRESRSKVFLEDWTIPRTTDEFEDFSNKKKYFERLVFSWSERLRQRYYFAGFAAIIIGVVIQIIANSLAWAAAFGLLT